MEVIYLDALFVLNLLADYLLCLSTGRICGLCLRRWRYLAAALLGALYAAAVYLPGLRFLSLPPLRLAAGLGMGLIAFGAERQPLRCAAVLLAVAAAFGGALWAISLASGGSGGYVPLSGRILLLAFALCYGVLRLLFHFRARKAGRRLVSVTVGFLGREARFTALADTGNSLLDPLSGAQVWWPVPTPCGLCCGRTRSCSVLFRRWSCWSFPPGSRSCRAACVCCLTAPWAAAVCCRCSARTAC